MERASCVKISPPVMPRHRAFGRAGSGLRGWRDLKSRHCEQSEAIHLSAQKSMDCFASLAMTLKLRRHTMQSSPAKAGLAHRDKSAPDLRRMHRRRLADIFMREP